MTTETSAASEPVIREMIRDIASALRGLAAGREVAVVSAQTALHETEQPGEDAAVLAAVEALTTLWHAVAAAYVAAAGQIDALYEGALRQRGVDVPITAASLRIEGRVAAMMPARWLAEQASLWDEVADEIVS